jgi:hypothetical protein
VPEAWGDELARDLRKSEPRFIAVARGDALPAITYVNADCAKYINVYSGLPDLIAQDCSSVADLGSFVIYERIVFR